MLARLQTLGWQVEGLDVDAMAVQQARSKGLKIHQGDLKSQRYEADSFDIITLNHAIEHVRRPLELMEECCRILKPGGRLVIYTPNIESWGHRVFQETWLHLDPPRHLFLFSGAAITELLKRAGFKSFSSATSAEGALGSYQANRAIAATGRYHLGSNSGRYEQVMGRLFFWLESAMIVRRPNWGEQLIIVGEK